MNILEDFILGLRPEISLVAGLFAFYIITGGMLILICAFKKKGFRNLFDLQKNNRIGVIAFVLVGLYIMVFLGIFFAATFKMAGLQFYTGIISGSAVGYLCGLILCVLGLRVELDKSQGGD
ncbi:MAG: hypothetical protein OEM02_03760 [Desulfobulbaceae bacterium]|nr:hypothetical protein [Desulfobulbaceae bacterium]